MMDNNCKIIIIGPSVDENYNGGVSTHIKNLKKLDVFRAAILFDPGSRNSNNRKSPLTIIKNLFSLNRLVRRNDNNIILINSSIYQSSIVKLLLILRSIPINRVRQIHVYFHGGRFESVYMVKNIFTNILMQKLFKRATIYHFLCNEQKDGFEKYFKGFRTAIYSNYSKDNTIIDRKIENDSYLQLLYVGRIVVEKGLYELLDAIEIINRKEENRVRLNIVGSGPEIEKLKKKANDLNLKHIEFKGYLSGDVLDEEYKNADVMVIPSYKEAFPYTMIESLRAGLPIIATSTGAMNELLIDGKNGFIVDPRSPESIVNAIHKCIENKTMLSEMSNNCYKLYTTRLTKIKAEQYYYNLIKANSLPEKK